MITIHVIAERNVIELKDCKFTKELLKLLILLIQKTCLLILLTKISREL